MFERVRHRQTFFGKLWYIYGQRLHRWMIAKDANVYLKPNDIISHRPTLFGMHEPHIEALITEASATHGDFLLDIGANIGMTSALVGRRFARVDCVEPNELVVNILKTNLAMNLSATEHEVHAVGLGKEDGVLTLACHPTISAVPMSRTATRSLTVRRPPGTAINSVTVPIIWRSMW